MCGGLIYWLRRTVMSQDVAVIGIRRRVVIEGNEVFSAHENKTIKGRPAPTFLRIENNVLF